jgi:group I intron endonuclease
MDTYKIYKITNNITGKLYIGLTKRDLKIRFRQHCYVNKCAYLFRAIKKYGPQNFSINELTRVNSLGEAQKQESRYIIELNTLCPNGYNLTIEDSKREFCSETKNKMSVSQQGNKNKLNKIGFIGVAKNAKADSFRATIRKNKKPFVKSFKTAQEAAEAYDKIVIFLYGPKAKINFIDNLKDYLREDLLSFYNWFIDRHTNTSSKFKGVSFHKLSGKWQGFVNKNKQRKYLGLFSSEIEAKKAVEDYNESHT